MKPSLWSKIKARLTPSNTEHTQLANSSQLLQMCSLSPPQVQCTTLCPSIFRYVSLPIIYSHFPTKSCISEDKLECHWLSKPSLVPSHVAPVTPSPSTQSIAAVGFLVLKSISRQIRKILSISGKPSASQNTGSFFIPITQALSRTQPQVCSHT